MDAATCEHRLLNDFQHGFPLHPRPFAELGRRLGLPEHDVLGTLSRLRQEGKISRIGAVLSPMRFGASTLAAMRVPPERLEEIAHRISRFPEVNHNYAREHRFNLWFVVTAASQVDLQTALRKIECEAEHALLSLPLVEAFHIDLGFPLSGALTDNNVEAGSVVCVEDKAECAAKDDKDLIAALQDGLPLEARPFRRLAERAAMTEQEVIARLRRWQAQGDIRRFGVIVRHRALGYAANAMLVHDVPDAEVGQIGRRLAQDPGITLCYRRARVLPDWPYNLFCMIHGRERAEVVEYIACLRERYGLFQLPHEVLFSSHCFKQTGARYA